MLLEIMVPLQTAGETQSRITETHMDVAAAGISSYFLWRDGSARGGKRDRRRTFS